MLIHFLLCLKLYVGIHEIFFLSMIILTEVLELLD